MQTLKQLADYLGTTKTTIRNKLTELDLMGETAKNDKGVIVIPDHVCSLVIDYYRKTVKQPDNEPESEPESKADNNPVILALIEQLTAQLAVKDAQIASMQQTIDSLSEHAKQQQSSIATLTTALHNAQALTAGTLQTFQQLTAKATQQAEHTDTASTPDAEIQHDPQPAEQAEAEPAQQAEPPKAEPQQPQQAEPQQPDPQQAADTSGTPSEPLQSHTSNAIKQSQTNNSTAQNNRVRPLSLLQSLFNRK